MAELSGELDQLKEKYGIDVSYMKDGGRHKLITSIGDKELMSLLFDLVKSQGPSAIAMLLKRG